MKHLLLFAALLTGNVVAAQSRTALPPLAALPALTETSMQPVMSNTTVANTPGVRYRYQQVHLDNGRIWLASAWRGQTKLEPTRRLLNTEAVGELDGFLLQTINELAADGWDLVEVRSLSRPVEATQKIETALQFSDPNRPVYMGTTTFSISSETRYLFRKALVN